MSQRNKYWDDIIEQYRASGLSQPAFCKQNELSCNQFQYRWYLHNREKNAKSKLIRHQDGASSHSFESVSISIPAPILQPEPNDVVELLIHLPNQISCVVKMDFRTNGFATLLKQLVTLC
jgi:hypothetical protein